MSAIADQHQAALNRIADLESQIASKQRQLAEQRALVAALEPALPPPEPAAAAATKPEAKK
ncbi:MAG: hypothetical protein ABMA13_18395 [Chthoniobacteraceae bacterium]